MAVALSVGFVAGAILYAAYVTNPGRSTDFGQIWFSARALLQGRDPYLLVGPKLEYNLDYPLLYPATAFVAAMPFALMSKELASISFVAISALLLTYSITARSWHRLPLLASAAFLDSVLSGQWTLLLTAALFLPWLAAFAVAKPQTGIPVVAASTSPTTLRWATIGFLAFLGVSLYMLPNWPGEWLTLVSHATHIRAPVMSPAGVLAIFLLLRWRRPESWLVIASACVPQTFMWYSAMILLTVGETYREACVLSLISTGGFLLASLAVDEGLNHLPLLTYTIYVCTTLVPVVLLILRRPNEGELPAWLTWTRNATKALRQRV